MAINKFADTTICADATNINNKDQRGTVRPQGPQCDVGAFEVVAPTIMISTASNLPAAKVGTAYNQTLAATGGNSHIPLR